MRINSIRELMNSQTQKYYQLKSESESEISPDKVFTWHPLRLPRILGTWETWGFGMSGLLLWLGVAPAMQAELGVGAIFVWIPGAIVGILLNLQIKRLGEHQLNVSGGTPNYATHLLKNYPGLASYGAIGYWLGWVSVPPMNAIILTELIKVNLNNIGISCPENLLKIGFTILPYIVAFSGTRALGILHLCFVIPAIGFLLVFCGQGMGWLLISPASPGFFPNSWPSFNFIAWAKWFFMAVYAVCGCETASSFVADSRHPQATLASLKFAAWLIVPVYLGGSWLFIRLANNPNFGDNTFLYMVTSATPFWGNLASSLVIFLIASGCLLSSSTAVANSPRVLYQLAKDKYLAPLFGVVSQRGVLGPAMIFTFILSLICLLWGDVSHVVMVTGTGYLASIMAVHLGLWLRRGNGEVLFPWCSGVFLLIEVLVFVVGGLAWGVNDLAVGFLLPIAILVTNTAIKHIPLNIFHADWWINFYSRRSKIYIKDFMALQVGIPIFLLCSAVAIGWFFGLKIPDNSQISFDLLVIVMLIVAFVGVAIACWTSLPQVAAIVEAREQAEHLFNIALDAILVLDENGIIRQVNPATEKLFQVAADNLIGRYFNEIISGLNHNPQFWPQRSEQNLNQPYQEASIVEVAISENCYQNFCEYVVILRDITAKKKAELELCQALHIQEQLTITATEQTKKLEQTLQSLQHTQAQLIQNEKMSSLGQLVAGVAHEINNPINFIYGNLDYVKEYVQNLFDLIEVYQKNHLDKNNPEIQNCLENIDLDFLKYDLPKILASMKVGSDRIRQIVLSLRNFSRLDEADMKIVDIHQGIDSTLMILQNRFNVNPEFPAIQIVKDYGNLPNIECYPGKLNQVFINLINNAIDALEESCQQNKRYSQAFQTMYLPTIQICTFMLNPYWIRISIKDNGIGIPESVRSKIFDPFFTTKPIGKGTGLGLSVSYQIIVEKHQGSLNCISFPGKGTEFHIDIPINSRVN